MLTETVTDSRSIERRRVYLGEGLTFEVSVDGVPVTAEAIDLTSSGLGLAVVHAPLLPGVGDTVTVRYTGRGAAAEPVAAVVRNLGCFRAGDRLYPRIGLSLVAAETGERGVRYPCATRSPPARRRGSIASGCGSGSLTPAPPG